MGRGNKPTKAQRLAEKREAQKERKESEEKVSARERLVDRKRTTKIKKKQAQDELERIDALVRNDAELSGKWCDLKRRIELMEHNLSHISARLNPQKFLKQFELLPLVSVFGVPHKSMQENLTKIRKTYPENTEFAIRLFVGIILSKDFLGPAAYDGEALRCYHTKNGVSLHCDCTKTSTGFILSKERQKLEDDLKFVVNNVILQSQLSLLERVCSNTPRDEKVDIPNPYSPFLTGLKIQ